MKKEKKQKQEVELEKVADEKMDEDELDQVTGGAMAGIHINKTSDISESVKKRI